MTDDVLAVDLFCGAGGLSWGLAQACEQLGRDVELVAVNHWERAIETHEANHPWAEHHHARVEELRPQDVVPDRRVDVLVCGPECTHFSTARGGRPVTDQKRASPFHVLDWLEKLDVQNVLLENVPEFRSWGPVEDGEPTRNGEKFDAYVQQLCAEGYAVDWRVLNAADYGDATSRRRFFLMARKQHRVEWPQPTHSEDGEEPGTHEWRAAAEIIDWSDPGESIWRRDRPLVNNTMQRIAEGLRRYGEDVLEPFAAAIAELGKEDIEQMQDRVVPADWAPEYASRWDEPFLVEVPRDERGSTGRTLCQPYLLGQQSGAVPRCVYRKPTPTIASRGAIGFYKPCAFVLPRNGYHRGLHSNPAYDPEDRPLHTVTARNHDGHLVTPYLVPFYGEREGQRPRTHSIDGPLPTVTATGSQPAITRPYLVEYNGNSSVKPVDEPLPTVTTRDRFALCLPDMYPWGLDIRFRMLQPRELAAAMGFPSDYEFRGNKTETIEQIGNAVPVNLAAALCERLLASQVPTVDGYGEPAKGGAEADD